MGREGRGVKATPHLFSQPGPFRSAKLPRRFPRSSARPILAAMSATLATLARRALGSAPTLHPAACWAAPAAVRHMHVSSAAAAGSRGGAASGGGGSGSGGGAPPAADAFTAALQQKTEEELRQLALKQGQPSTAAAEEQATEQAAGEVRRLGGPRAANAR